MTDYLLTGAIKDAATIVAKAIERHAQAQITAAKIEANAHAYAAGYRTPIHTDVDGAR